MPKQNKKITNSPFRYPGGKFYARKLILKCIPEHDKYCEPFAGGSSIFFAKNNVKFNILNDKDEELVNCYIQIRDNVNKLILLLEGIPAKKELHSYYKNEFNPSNDLERAMRWFYLNRTSYSGIMKHQNCYWGYGDKYSMRPENWAFHLRTTSERLQNIEVYNLDFEILINQLPNGYFLFIDPPYFNADQNKFYTCYFTQEDHERLCQLLKKHQHRFQFLITYDNSPEIREMYNWCVSKQDREWNYTISRTDDQKNGRKLENGYQSGRYKGKELFIANYDVESIIGVEPLQFNKPKYQSPNCVQMNLFDVAKI
ncbi:DNA adenine methylase [Nodularia spumigena]|uniref:DNA adenine methylase n=1 Tax=Nodularia spumigena TaxID=70799 RepID=UPI00232B5AC3|nr:DNA adenine methylase [Nodularia spumigena]MDB9317247.1 DNA adenine methylase [Nodularia spumigena CS-590/01A]MDB9321743.1 DNA adenine methylase [Nodularia spumigena CS-591/07A]MDB9324801.1 DNA adenine methylase [Nodularia spumigena CS-590/02]MDB9331275.1 DNA adenine methylase [Nodularia spumigena CS-591/04]MDB9336487.1 DNA adenine methylase [Nodularia spumigena CS-590/01]